MVTALYWLVVVFLAASMLVMVGSVIGLAVWALYLIARSKK